MNLSDISSRDDINLIIEEFYSLLQQDTLVKDKFENLNLEKHIPVIVEFWNSILFGSNSYHGDPFGKHIRLNLSSSDFERWLQLFSDTINKYFKGDRADEMINRANSIANIFKYKLNLE